MLGGGWDWFVARAAEACVRVHEAKRRGTADRCAIKVCTSSNASLTGAELYYLRAVDSINIVRALDGWHSPWYVVIVMEHCDMDLHAMIGASGRLAGEPLDDVVQQLATGLDCLHRAHLLHRDLHSKNILVKHRQPHAVEACPPHAVANSTVIVKIGDLGTACVQASTERPADLTHYVAACHIRPPEVLFAFGSRVDDAGTVHGPRFCRYGTPLDCWALGCLYLLLADGRLPFRGQTSGEVATKLMEVLGQPPSSLVARERWSREVIAVRGGRGRTTSTAPRCWQRALKAQFLLKYDPEARATAEQFTNLAALPEPR